MTNNLAMSAMWLDASTDHDAEDHRRQVVAAKVGLSGTWPFLAAAHSDEDFDHRLALMREQIEDATPSDVLADVVASLRQDWGVLAAERVHEAQQARTAALTVTAASFPDEALPSAYVHVQRRGEGPEGYWQVDHVHSPEHVQTLARTASREQAYAHVARGVPTFENGAYVGGYELAKVAADEEYFDTASGQWFRRVGTYQPDPAASWRYHYPPTPPASDYGGSPAGPGEHQNGPDGFPLDVSTDEQRSPEAFARQTTPGPWTVTPGTEWPGSTLPNAATGLPQGVVPNGNPATAGVENTAYGRTGAVHTARETPKQGERVFVPHFMGEEELDGQKGFHAKVLAEPGQHQYADRSEEHLMRTDPHRAGDTDFFHYFGSRHTAKDYGPGEPIPTPFLSVYENPAKHRHQVDLIHSPSMVQTLHRTHSPDEALAVATAYSDQNGVPVYQYGKHLHGKQASTESGTSDDFHGTDKAQWKCQDCGSYSTGSKCSNCGTKKASLHHAQEGVAPGTHAPNPNYFSVGTEGLAGPPTFPVDPAAEPTPPDQINPMVNVYGGVPPEHSTGSATTGTQDGGYTRQAAAIPKGRQLCSNCDGQGTVGLSSSEGEHQCPQCNGKGHVKMGSHQRTAYSISQSLHSMESGDEQSFGAGKGGKKGGVHHVRYDAEQALGDDNQPAPGYTVGGYTVTSPGSAPAYYRHSPYKPNSSLGMAKMYAAEQAEKHIWHHERQHSASARTAEYQYVKKQGDQWVITQKGTGKVLSHHASEEDAKASFRAMMQSKHSGARSPDFPQSARERTASGPYQNRGQQGEHYGDPNFAPPTGPEGEDSDCNCHTDRDERKITVNPLCPLHGHYAKESRRKQARWEPDESDPQTHKQRGFYDAQHRRPYAGEEHQDHPTARAYREGWDQWHSNAPKTAMPERHPEGTDPESGPYHEVTGAKAPPQMAHEEFAEGQAHAARGLPPETAFGDIDDIYDAGYSSRRHELGRMASTSGQIVGHCDHCRHPVRWHDGDGESGSDNGDGHLEHLHNSSHKCNVGASSTNVAHTGAHTATLNGLTTLPQFFDLTRTAQGGFATDNNGAGAVDPGMAAGGGSGAGMDPGFAAGGAPMGSPAGGGIDDSNVPQASGMDLSSVSSANVAYQPDNLTHTSLQTITAPTPENPSGRSEDEYKANTWRGQVEQRPMQSAEDRHINTPVLPQEPAHKPRNINTPTPGLHDENEDSIQGEDERDDEDEED